MDVTFLEFNHSERTLVPHRGPGTVEVRGDVIVLEGKRPRKLLNFLLGSVGFVVGVLVAAIATVALAEFDFDIMRYRKGGGLVAMVAIILAIGISGVLIQVGEWVFGHAKVRVAVPRSALEGVGSEEGRVAAVWAHGKKMMWMVVQPTDSSPQVLLDLLRGTG
jgi:hypothetical protein